MYGLWNRIRMDVFDFAGTNFRRAAFGDTANRAERLVGGVVGAALAPQSAKPTSFADAFWYDYRVQRAWGGRAARDRRDVYGVYLHGTMGRAKLNASLVRQSGWFGNRPVSASGVFVNADYLLAATRWQPRLGIRFERASGGGAYDRGTLHDFTVIHGGTGRIDYSNALAYTNARIAGLAFSFKPARPWTVALEADQVDRVAENDAVYSTSGMKPYAGTQNVRGRRVGTLYRASTTWAIDRHLTWQLSVDRLAAGTVLRRAGYDGQGFVRSLLTFRY